MHFDVDLGHANVFLRNCMDDVCIDFGTQSVYGVSHTLGQALEEVLQNFEAVSCLISFYALGDLLLTLLVSRSTRASLPLFLWTLSPQPTWASSRPAKTLPSAMTSFHSRI